MVSEAQLDADLRTETTLHEEVKAQEIFTDIKQHLTPDMDITYVHHKLEELPSEHPLWRLESLNGIYANANDKLSEADRSELQSEIMDATYSLIARRLPMDELIGSGMPAVYFDEANKRSAVTLNSVYVVGQAWENTGRNEQLQDYMEKMIDYLDEGNTGNSKLRNEERATFYKSLYTGIPYHEAILQRIAQGNEIDVYSKAGDKLIHLYMEHYDTH